MAEAPEPTRRGEPIWLEPYPDVLLDDKGSLSGHGGRRIVSGRA
jgi:hypothetical protein